MRRGQLDAMAGASRRHNLITGNLIRELENVLRHQPCEVYPSDLRVRVADTGLYTHPDVVVVCGEPANRPIMMGPDHESWRWPSLPEKTKKAPRRFQGPCRP